MSSKQPDAKKPQQQQHVLLGRNCCLGVVLLRTTSGATTSDDGPGIFSDFLRQNSMCFWNGCLTRSVATLEYKGCVVPSTILISGSEFALEVVRSAWARRVLRPPKGYSISKLGDIGSLDLHPVSQTQFAPLSEAVCVAVGELNSASSSATSASVRRRLGQEFPEMRLPSVDILHATLGQLIKERKLYHTGEGYFVVSPDTYRQRSVSPVCERQMLMTNEEAIVKMMHGGGRRATTSTQVDEGDIASTSSSYAFLQARRRDVSCQITQVPPSPDLQYLERSHSLKILRCSTKSRPKSTSGGSFKENNRTGYVPSELDSDHINDLHKTEKQSMLAKILKRMQSLTEKSSSKHVSFSAQFPPLEWLDTAKFHSHSVATQTLLEKVGPTLSLKRLETSSPKHQWPESERDIPHYFYSNGIPKTTTDDPQPHSQRKNAPVPMRQGAFRYSPTHRYSHGAFTNHSKRRHKHRRSSSESPKIHKNGYSTGSKSPTEHSDAKISVSSSSGGYNLISNPKAIVNPRLRNQDPLGLSNSYPYKRHGTLPRAMERNTARDLFTYSPKLSKQVYQPERFGEVKTIKSFSPKVLPKPVQNIPYVAPTRESKKEDNQQSSNKPGLQEVVKQNNVNSRKLEESSVLGDVKLAPSESLSDTSVSCNGKDHAKKESLQTNNDLAPVRQNLRIKPLVLKSFVESPKAKVEKISPTKKEIVVDNSVSVEVAVEKSPSPTNKKSNNVSTTIVTEETTVTNGKGNSKVVTTVTSITTSLSQGGIKDLDKVSPEDKEVSSEKDKSSVNDLNIESGKGSRIIDCTSSCNIVTEVK